MLDRLIALFLFLLPFQFALNPAPDIDLPLGRIFVVIIFFWWLAQGLAERSLHLSKAVISGVLLSFFVWATFSLSWGDNLSFALRKWFFLANFLPLFFVFYDRATNDSSVVLLWLRALVFGASLNALVTLAIFSLQVFLPVGSIHAWLVESLLPFFLGENLSHMVAEYSSLLVNVGGVTILRATGVFPDPHIASFYFGLTGLLALGLAVRYRRGLYFGGTFLLLGVDLLTFSRGGYLGLLMGLIIFGMLGWKQLSSRLQTGMLLFFVSTVAFAFLAGQPILLRFISSFTLSDASNSERVLLWEEAEHFIGAHPFLGAGIGNYALAVDPTVAYRTPYYAHNLYLDVAAELGLPGLFFFLFVILGTYGHLSRTILRGSGGFSLSLLSALTLYLTHSFFETALYSVHILPIFLFVLALAWYDGEYESRSLK